VNLPEYQVRVLPVAEDDLNEIVDYISVENPRAAQKLLDRIVKNLEYLTTHPYLGKIPDEIDFARMGYRFLVVENYLIFYTIEYNVVIVHRVIHGARNYLDLL